MTKKIELKSITRAASEKNINDLRKSGFVPGVLYGVGITNVSLKLKKVELEKAFEKAGESSLIDLQIDDQASFKAIIKDVQIHAVKGTIEHVDLFQVNMNKAIEVELPFVFVGESKAEREAGATIMKNMESVLVKCLPGELLENIEIDLSKLEKLGDAIRVMDLVLPKSFEVLSDSHETIVNATEQKVEVEEVKPVVAEVPVATKDAKKDAEPKAAAPKKK